MASAFSPFINGREVRVRATSLMGYMVSRNRNQVDAWVSPGDLFVELPWLRKSTADSNPKHSFPVTAQMLRPRAPLDDR